MRKAKKTKSRGISLLRAIAIVAVIIFHISAKALPGGFLGVDLFFVMSGYLTMNSLYEKYTSRKSVSIRQFLLKKYKKLSPALYSMIVAVLIFLVLFNKPVLQNSNLDALAGFTFTSNIWYIVKKVDYFSSFAAKPFNHLWYLGVQFQFYIGIIILFKIFGLNKEKRFDGFTKAAFVLFLASFISNIIIFDINNINRIYYGTDTRAFEFLLGVLAARLMPIRYAEYKYPYFKKFKGLISIISISIFLLLTKMISQYSFWLYRGGFLVIAILCLIMIYSTSAVVRNKIAKVIDKTPLNFIGDMSYDLYIWHYPIIVLSQTASETNDINLTYTIIRLIATFIISLLVKEFIVDSIDRYTVSGSINRLIERHKRRSVTGKRITLSLSLVLLILTLMGLTGKAIPYLSTALLKEDKTVDIGESYVAKDDKNKNASKKDSPKKDSNENSDDLKSDKKQKKKSKKYNPLELKSLEIGRYNAKTGYPEIDNPKKDPKKMTLEENIEEMSYNQLVVVGDSLAVNVGPAIKEAYPDTIADGKISRQLYNSAEVVNQYVDYDSEDTALIFLLGTNGVFMEEHIDELISSFKLSDVYFVNIKVPGNYEEQVNSTLKSYANKHSDRVSIIDWNTVAKEHDEYFEPDNTHLNKIGVNAIVKLIFEELSNK